MHAAVGELQEGSANSAPAVRISASPADLAAVASKNEMPAPGAHSKIRHLAALDGLRFLAALSILIGHAWNAIVQFKGYPQLSSAGGVVAIVGMPLFFVLSGFVIHYNYGHLFLTTRTRWAVCEFLGARFARLYPLFLASVFVGYSIQGIFLWLGHYDFAFALLTLHNVTLTQSWVYQIMFERLMLYFGFGIGWSISTEWFFYLVFIAFVIPLGRQTNAARLLLGAAVYSALVFILLTSSRTAVATMGESLHALESGPYAFTHWFYYFSPYVRIFEFGLGCMIAQLYRIVRDQTPSRLETRIGSGIAAAGVCLVTAAALIYFLKPHLPGMDSFNLLIENFGLAVPIGSIIFCVARYPIVLARWLSSRPMVILGERSYSIYAIHVLMVVLFARIPAGDLTTVTLFEALVRGGLVVVFTFMLASATYALIEVPGRAKLRRYFERRMVLAFGEKTLNYRHEVVSKIGSIKLIGAALALLSLCVIYQFVVAPLYGTIM
jgi:peptidoglycan/LPS O-acetylase OafA/YrhL